MGGTHRTETEPSRPVPPLDGFAPGSNMLAGVAVEVLYDPDDPSDAVLQMTIRSNDHEFTLAEMTLTSVKATKLQGQLQDQSEQASLAQHVAAGGEVDTFVPDFAPFQPTSEMPGEASQVEYAEDGDGDAEEDDDTDDDDTDGEASDGLKARGLRKAQRVGDPGGVKPGIKRLATEMPPIMGFPGIYVVYGSLALILVIAALISVVL